MMETQSHGARTSVYTSELFSRMDESSDREFYARDRFVSHLDRLALDTVEKLIGNLTVEKDPVVLDLMAGWDSHLPEDFSAREVVGVGLNDNELKQNPRLTRYVLHDLNEDPILPFEDGTFDVVLNTVSVDYMTRPLEVFREIARILKPGGLFLVIFSNRMFPQKAVKIWKESNEAERVMLVEDFFRVTNDFEPARVFVSKGKPRPTDDKYAYLGIPSDPIYAVSADKKGGNPDRPERPLPKLDSVEITDPALVEARSAQVKSSLICPYCGERMKKWAVPQNPFTEWENEFMYVCFNDDCCYFRRGWDVMNEQGNMGFSYRLMYYPERDRLFPVAVPSFKALKESIVEEDCDA